MVTPSLLPTIFGLEDLNTWHSIQHCFHLNLHLSVRKNSDFWAATEGKFVHITVTQIPLQGIGVDSGLNGA